jgi:hypothetical protein
MVDMDGYQLEVLMKVLWCGSVEEGGSFTDEFRSGIVVSVEVFGEDVDEINDAIFHGLSDIAVLDEEVLGIGPDFGEGILEHNRSGFR